MPGNICLRAWFQNIPSRMWGKPCYTVG
ncbi:rCG21060 [Rattus norvegicus]|uniref:RCG21060 n=1 Tax=Rattus norvegicus TaxID=10116 RepID=A6KDM0_RAT|nr:rCG21060 [Rattus norvegicus]